MITRRAEGAFAMLYRDIKRKTDYGLAITKNGLFTIAEYHTKNGRQITTYLTDMLGEYATAQDARRALDEYAIVRGLEK